MSYNQRTFAGNVSSSRTNSDGTRPRRKQKSDASSRDVSVEIKVRIDPCRNRTIPLGVAFGEGLAAHVGTNTVTLQSARVCFAKVYSQVFPLSRFWKATAISLGANQELNFFYSVHSLSFQARLKLFDLKS
jgi:hypothetical protein